MRERTGTPQSVWSWPGTRALIIGLFVLGDGIRDGGLWGGLLIATAIWWFVIAAREFYRDGREAIRRA